MATTTTTTTTTNDDVDIVVIASCNIDLISYVDRIPKIGETLMGNRFQMGFGGKGANKAVACSRLGSKCAIIAKFGNDIFGNDYVDYLSKTNNINTTHVFRTDEAATGVAPIIVDSNGANSIVVVLGANLLLSSADIDACSSLVASSKILVANFEIPYATVLAALRLAKSHNVTTVLNFAPALTNYTSDVFDHVDYLILNEVEIEQLVASASFDANNDADVSGACTKLLEKYPRVQGVIVTLGSKGAIYADRLDDSSPKRVESEKVTVVDSTGAGDAFVGAFVHYLNHYGRASMAKVVRLACDYATLTVQYAGTQTSYVSVDKLDEKFKI